MHPVDKILLQYNSCPICGLPDGNTDGHIRTVHPIKDVLIYPEKTDAPKSPLST